MTFNAASWLRLFEDRSAALRCKMAGMHSVPKSAVLPYASGVGGLSRRLLNSLMGCHGGEEEVGQGVGNHSEQLEGWE